MSCSKAEVIFAFFPFKDSFFLFLKSVVLRINDSCSKSVDRREQERVEVTEDEPCPSRAPVGAWVHPPPFVGSSRQLTARARAQMHLSPRPASGAGIPTLQPGKLRLDAKLKAQFLVRGIFTNTKWVLPSSQGPWRDASPLPKHLCILLGRLPVRLSSQITPKAGPGAMVGNAARDLEDASGNAPLVVL